MWYKCNLRVLSSYLLLTGKRGGVRPPPAPTALKSPHQQSQGASRRSGILDVAKTGRRLSECSHLGGCHRHVNLLSVEHERPNDSHGNRDVPAHDLAVCAKDALVVVALPHPHRHTSRDTRRQTSQWIHHRTQLQGFASRSSLRKTTGHS